MDIQMRRILRQLYPSRSGNGRHRDDASERRFLGRFVDRRLKQARTRFKRIGKKRLVLTVIFSLVMLTSGGLIYYYNRFLAMKADVEAAKSQIGVQLQRRKDIVAELNTIVLAYAQHEKEIFQYALDTRKEIMGPPSAAAAEEAPASGPRPPTPFGNVDASLSKIFAVAEGFPDLRLSENFQRMMDALVEVETAVAERRMLLNERSNDMATALNIFPAFVFNWLLRFKVPEFYVPDEDVYTPITMGIMASSVRAAPQVESSGEKGHE